MSNTIRFIIDGESVAKERPRLGKGRSTFTPQRTKNYEKKVADRFLSSGGQAIDGYVRADIKIYKHVLAKYKSKANTEKCLNGTYRPEAHGDIDNITKSILDGLNGVAYTDDKLVQEIHVEKWYAEKDYVVVELSKI